MSEQSQENLERVYSARDLDELKASYASWAEQYDRDVMAMGYQVPGLVAGMTARHVPQSAGPILDCGAGTGLVGLLLAGLRYDDVAAMDMSEDMLALARGRGCYNDVRRGVLGERLDYSDDRFAAIIAAGVFTRGHAPASAYEEIARILRPGGYFIVSERVDGDTNAAYRASREALARDGIWSLVEESNVVIPFPLEPAEAEIRSQVLVYRAD